jgi:hypothetical protein
MNDDVRLLVSLQARMLDRSERMITLSNICGGDYADVDDYETMNDLRDVQEAEGARVYALRNRLGI